MADSHASYYRHLRFHLPQEWKKPEIILQIVGALLLIATLGATVYQIKKSTDATNAQTIYTAEKDFSSLFSEAGKSAAFQNCFGPNSQSPLGGCVARDARELYYSILQHYRLLKVMNTKSVIPRDYYESRIFGFCSYTKSPAARAEMKELADQKKLDPGLQADINTICKLQ